MGFDQRARLTVEQRERLPSFVQEWIEYGWRTTSLTDAEWKLWETGVRNCYEAAGRRWPGVVVRVGSPIVGALAAPIALSALRRLRRAKAPSTVAIDKTVTAVLGTMVDPAFRAAVHTAASAAARGALGATPSGAGQPQTRRPKTAWVELVVPPAPKTLHAAVHRQVYLEVFREVYFPVQFAVDSAIGYTVDRAVAASIPVQWHSDLIPRSYSWAAFAAFFLDEVKLPLGEQLWRQSRAGQDAHLTHWCWPTRDFVMVCDRPTELHAESVRDTYRLHNDSGPAIRWADGWSLHFWRGTRVPADLIETGWSADRILAEHNVEIRRCAIERMGWDQFVIVAELTPLDQAPDPANPGQRLPLYDVPRKFLNQPIRALLCTNATRERDGTRRSFGMTVPADCPTALAAAAWTFDIPESDYLNLARAT